MQMGTDGWRRRELTSQLSNAPQPRRSSSVIARSAVVGMCCADIMLVRCPKAAGLLPTSHRLLPLLPVPRVAPFQVRLPRGGAGAFGSATAAAERRDLLGITLIRIHRRSSAFIGGSIRFVDPSASS